MKYKQTAKLAYAQKRRPRQTAKSMAKQRGKQRPSPAAKAAAKLEAKEKPVERETSLLGTRKATLHFEGGKGVSVSANVRYETEKVDPLIKTKYMADGVEVHRRYVGPPKEEKWLDDSGKEHDKAHVELMQELPDGKLVPIKVEKTEDIDVEPVPKEVMGDFHPYSHLEVWGEKEKDEEGLRKVARNLITEGKVGAIKRFSHGVGGKVYVGFLYPVLSKDGKSFTVEVMLSENRRKRRRWMPAERLEGKAEREYGKPIVPDIIGGEKT